MNNQFKYVAESPLPVAVEEAFAYHERPGALQRLIPPWQSISIEKSDNSLAVGSQVILKTSMFGVPVRWVAEHTLYDPPRLFEDYQVSGPFAAWRHRHEFAEMPEGSMLRDAITYQLPLGILGQTFGGSLARHEIESMFAYRHRVTRDDLRVQVKYALAPRRVAVSGSSGLVGRNLSTFLGLLGHHVRPIVRSPVDDRQAIAVWSSPAEASKLNEVEVVVHLAGRSIGEARWTEAEKREIRDSRVKKTLELSESLAQLENKPKVLICASAVGIYGNRGDEELTESSDSGAGFLADVAREWEAACQPAVDAGIRVVHIRLGIVLSPNGGALGKMLLPAKLAGGRLGSGKQYWSWIALDDVLGAIYHCMANESLAGAVNLVAPQPVTNAAFANTLARTLNRPALFPAPEFALRAALGEMADEMLLASTRVRPTRLLESGYEFRFSDLDQALRHCLGKERLGAFGRPG